MSDRYLEQAEAAHPARDQGLALGAAIDDDLRSCSTCSGHPERSDGRADQLLIEYFGRAPRQGTRLPESLERWVNQQEAHLQVDGDAPPPRTPLVVERDGKRLTVRLLSGPAQRLLVLTEQVISVQPRTLELLGITRREAEVLAWVAEGKTNDDIATILGLSPRTVAKHLQMIYPKLGVETRTAAAARALALLRNPEP